MPPTPQRQINEGSVPHQAAGSSWQLRGVCASTVLPISRCEVGHCAIPSVPFSPNNAATGEMAVTPSAASVANAERVFVKIVSDSFAQPKLCKLPLEARFGNVLKSLQLRGTLLFRGTPLPLTAVPLDFGMKTGHRNVVRLDFIPDELDDGGGGDPHLPLADHQRSSQLADGGGSPPEKPPRVLATKRQPDDEPPTPPDNNHQPAWLRGPAATSRSAHRSTSSPVPSDSERSSAAPSSHPPHDAAGPASASSRNVTDLESRSAEHRDPAPPKPSALLEPASPSQSDGRGDAPPEAQEHRGATATYQPVTLRTHVAPEPPTSQTVDLPPPPLTRPAPRSQTDDRDDTPPRRGSRRASLGSTTSSAATARRQTHSAAAPTAPAAPLRATPEPQASAKPDPSAPRQPVLQGHRSLPLPKGVVMSARKEAAAAPHADAEWQSPSGANAGPPGGWWVDTGAGFHLPPPQPRTTRQYANLAPPQAARPEGLSWAEGPYDMAYHGTYPGIAAAAGGSPPQWRGAFPSVAGGSLAAPMLTNYRHGAPHYPPPQQPSPVNGSWQFVPAPGGGYPQPTAAMLTFGAAGCVDDPLRNMNPPAQALPFQAGGGGNPMVGWQPAPPRAEHYGGGWSGGYAPMAANVSHALAALPLTRQGNHSSALVVAAVSREDFHDLHRSVVELREDLDTERMRRGVVEEEMSQLRSDVSRIAEAQRRISEQRTAELEHSKLMESLREQRASQRRVPGAAKLQQGAIAGMPPSEHAAASRTLCAAPLSDDLAASPVVAKPQENKPKPRPPGGNYSGLQQLARDLGGEVSRSASVASTVENGPVPRPAPKAYPQ